MTRKMMGVIYRAFKEGKLANTTQDDISRMYYWFDYFTNPMCGSAGRSAHYDEYLEFVNLKKAVTAIFEGNYQEAEKYTQGFSPAA